MRTFAAVLSNDPPTLKTLEATLTELGIELVTCPSQQEALEPVLGGHHGGGQCRALIVDFDLPAAAEVIHMAALLPPAQKPTLLALESRAWPGTGRAFQSGASRILYKPLDSEQLRDALKSSKKPTHRKLRKSARYEVKTLVYLELESSTLPAISIDIGENGLAVQAAELVPLTANLRFRCLLPGTHSTLEGCADVIWASDQGRTGLCFSQLAPEARKHLKHWLSKRNGHGKHAIHALLPPAGEHVHSMAELQE